MGNYKIAVLSGDGIGPEVTKEAVTLLQEIGERFGHRFDCEEALIGGIAVDETGSPLPESTLDLCRKSDAVLLGAVGGPKWDNESAERRPETGLLAMRKQLGLFANLRPVTIYPALRDSSPLKEEVLQGVDCLIIRELTGGLYFGTPKERRSTDAGEEAVDTLFYTEKEIERILRKAFEAARLRRNKVTSVDKANVLESSRLWREIAERIHNEYQDVELNHMLVDNAAMQLVRNPAQFDVIVTENMFGDILSDEASMLTGSLGMLPSASLSANGPGLFEPVHGSAPDIAGQNKANPLATMMSVSMMLAYSLNLTKEAAAIDRAISDVLAKGFRTGDIAGPEDEILSTTDMGAKVRAAVGVPAK